MLQSLGLLMKYIPTDISDIPCDALPVDPNGNYKLLMKYILIVISEIACEALLVDVNGTYKNANCTEQKTPYNESCELVCDLGYVASGDGVQTCQLNGNWSSHIHCVGEITRHFFLYKVGLAVMF